MVVDSSAVIAILQKEEAVDHHVQRRRLRRGGGVRRQRRPARRGATCGMRGREQEQLSPAAAELAPGRGATLAAKEGASINQFINVAVADKLATLRTEDYFRERAERADVPAALALLERFGTEPPRPGDEVEAPDGRKDRGGLRLAQEGRRTGRRRARRGGER